MLKPINRLGISLESWTKCLIVFFVILTTIPNVCAQNLNTKNFVDKIADKMELYGVKMHSPILFIHFDKNVYTNNENVWFTAYFLNFSNQKAYKVLSVALVRDDDHLLVDNEKFMVNSGLAFGNMTIPDSTAAGNYSFIAYGNRLVDGKPDVLFTQKIIIKRDAQTGYNASLNPLDTATANARQKVMLLVTNNDLKKPVKKPTATYYLGNSAYPAMKGDVDITTAGQYIFDIPSDLIRQGENRLHVRVNQAGEVKDLNIDLPARPQPAIVNFFPEGGSIVTGLPNVVAWEVKAHTGQGLAADAILYENKKRIDTIHTNSYGFGKFKLTPKTDAVYTVKLFGINKIDTLYKLPVAISHVPVMSVPSAVAGNRLTVEINTDKPQLVYLNLHNYARLFSSTPVNLAAGEKKIAIVLNDMPKGLTQITMTDSLGRPLSERLFFAHYDKRPELQINTNKAQYKSREKVTLSLKLNNINLPDSGLVSIACVQENRLSVNNKNDIESYFYLKNQLGDLPVRENYLGTEEADKNFLEAILLIKGWRRYTWLDMLKVKPEDTIVTRSEIVFKGLVTKHGAKIPAPVDIVNFNYPLHTITTDAAGNFRVNENDLVIPANRKVSFFVQNDTRQIYQIKLNDPYISTTDSILKKIEFADQNLPQQQSTQLLEMNGSERSIQLKEVKIKGRNNSAYASGFGPNACGDYVCRYGYLNCAIHRNEPDNVPAQSGKFYFVGSIRMLYAGCIPDPEKGLSFKGIYGAQEFYPTDFSQGNSQPEYISTIYWKYLAKVTSSNTAEFSFYTNDITGRFKIVVQGRTANDMIYGEQSFEVSKN